MEIDESEEVEEEEEEKVSGIEGEDTCRADFLERNDDDGTCIAVAVEGECCSESRTKPGLSISISSSFRILLIRLEGAMGSKPASCSMAAKSPDLVSASSVRVWAREFLVSSSSFIIWIW